MYIMYRARMYKCGSAYVYYEKSLAEVIYDHGVQLYFVQKYNSEQNHESSQTIHS